MQAESVQEQSSVQGARRSALSILTVLHIGLHAMWLIALTVVDNEEYGATQYAITSSTLLIGLAALVVMWRGAVWGRWILLVVTAMQLFFTVPEVFILEGGLRVVSIVALLGLVAMMTMLFRPEVRNRV